MIKHYKVGLFISICCCLEVGCFGQAIENVKARLEGENLVVTYDLLNGTANDKFAVSLRSSHNNFATALAQLSGNVGDNVFPGKNRRVVWAVKNELPSDFDADIVIKVTASLLALPLTVQPLAQNTVKKGQSIALRWQGGRSTDKIDISLFKNGVPQEQLANGISNSKQFQYTVPSALKGSGYSFKISTANREVVTGAFKVKSKTKTIFIIVPVAIIGAAAVFLGGGKTETGGTTNTAQELPAPLKPGN
jgi:hypothetical protein